MLLPPPAFPVVAFALGALCASTLLLVTVAYFRIRREVQTVEDAIYRQLDRENTRFSDEVRTSEDRVMRAIEIQSTYLRQQIEAPLTALENKVEEIESDLLHSTANLKIRVDDLEAVAAKSRGTSAILADVSVDGGTVTPTDAPAPTGTKTVKSRKK